MDSEKPAYTVDYRGREGAPSEGKEILLSVEHASERLPAPYSWSNADVEMFRGQGCHWTHDPGAREFAEELSETLGCMAVYSNFSRLLIDPNRPLASETLIRQKTNTETIEFNALLHRDDIDWRISRYYVTYHKELGAEAQQCNAKFLLSIHSFTKEYTPGQIRDFDMGVLATSKKDPAALRLQSSLRKAGYDARLNEPWSGKDGFMFAADCVKVSSEPGTRQAIMLEVRNDLMVDPGWRSEAVAATASGVLDLVRAGTSEAEEAYSSRVKKSKPSTT